jgi:preprotein translocase subunit SecD
MLFRTRWNVAAILLAALVACVFVLFNFLPERGVARWPVWTQRAAGIDLQDGSSLLLGLDPNAALKEPLQALAGDVSRVLRQARIPFTDRAIRGKSVEVRITRDADIANAMNILGQLSGPLSRSDPPRRLDVAANGSLITLTLTEAAIAGYVHLAVDESVEIVKRRVSELGLQGAAVTQQSGGILVQVPGLHDTSRLKEILGQTANLEFRMVDQSISVEQAIATHPPPDSEILDGQKGEKYLIEKRVLVSGTDLVDAQPSFDLRTSEPEVSFRFNSSGARKFAEATRQNVHRPFAIVIDNRVMSAPVIQEPILGGGGQITGNFTVQQAYDLAMLLRAGALPAPLTIVEEHTVTPSSNPH